MHNFIKDYPRATVAVVMGLLTLCFSLAGFGWKESIQAQKENTCAVKDLTILMTRWSTETEALKEDVKENSVDLKNHEIRLVKLEK